MPLSSGDEGLQDRAWPTGGHARVTPRSRGYPETASFSEWGGGGESPREEDLKWNGSRVGPSWLSCIQWNLSIEDTTGTQMAVLYTVEPLYRGHHWDPAGCPVYSGTSL